MACALDRITVADQRGELSHWMVVVVVAGCGSIVAKQRRDRCRAVGRVRQKTNFLFIRLVRHHVLGSQVAIVAAEAEKNAADFLRSAGDRGGQNFRIFAVVAERNRLAVQWAGILSPQCIAACIRAAAVSRTKGPAVRCVASCAAAAALLCAPRTSTVDDAF